METLPHGLQRDRHLELAGRRGEPWARRIVIGLLGLVVVAALLGTVGQSPTTLQAQVPAATLTVKAPERVRSAFLEHVRAPF